MRVWLIFYFACNIFLTYVFQNMIRQRFYMINFFYILLFNNFQRISKTVWIIRVIFIYFRYEIEDYISGMLYILIQISLRSIDTLKSVRSEETISIWNGTVLKTVYRNSLMCAALIIMNDYHERATYTIINNLHRVWLLISVFSRCFRYVLM